jgi:coenzyme A diphosphatase NUDT7
LTRTGFFAQIGVTVVPVIGMLSDIKAFSPIPNAAEVDAIFNTPLEMFLKFLL